MENYTIILFVLGVMVLLSALADKIKIASPIVLILTGIAIGFLPGMPGLAIDPRIIFLLFLPPLLYDAAFNISFQGFRANLSTISSLAGRDAWDYVAGYRHRAARHIGQRTAFPDEE